VSPLDRKLTRDLWRMKGQVLTIAMVVAAGIAAFITIKGTFVSIELARTAYYERSRFADVFSHLERAPDALREDLEQLDGVSRTQTRVVEGAMMPLATMSQPVKALVISAPEPGQAALNDLLLLQGRHVERGRGDEVVVLHAFAEAHELEIGAALPVVVNGRMRELRMVGIVMSPEYVMAVSAGDLSPDPKRFAVLWMEREAIAAAFAMEGAFNDVAVQLQPGASPAKVKAALDRLLKPYGGTGAVARDKQLSNYVVEGELSQLKSMASVVPAIFLAVAALLLNIVLSRLVHLQRPEIATLKAVGYSNVAVGMYFLKMVLVIGVLGGILGVGIGAWLGGAFVNLYAEYFKFPDLRFRLDAQAAGTAVMSSLLAAGVGAFSAVRQVIKLPPAEAMRPAAPARYRRSIFDILGIRRLVGPATNMIVRELERRPLRSLGSALAIAASVGLLVVAGWYQEGLDALLYTQFHEVMREDVMVTFIEPRPERAIRELGKVPGVLDAEGLRTVPVRFRSEHRLRDGAIWGYAEAANMRTLRDKWGHPVSLPPDGVVLTEMLGKLLDVKVGDTIDLEILEGRRETKQLRVSGFVDEGFGLQGHMRLEVMRHWLAEEPVVSLGLLRIDPAASALIDARLKKLPYVASVSRRGDIFERFREQSADMILTMTFIISLFGGVITVGVVYNNARVALSLRGRDLASLRVLGFRRSEISAILLGEMAIQVIVALPIGFVLGHWMVEGIASTIDPETYRLPIVVTGRSYAFAALVALGASAVSALLVRRKLDRLDLISVLKTRE
jgi:putative ABC transport system permease protein